MVRISPAVLRSGLLPDESQAEHARIVLPHIGEHHPQKAVDAGLCSAPVGAAAFVLYRCDDTPPRTETPLGLCGRIECDDPQFAGCGQRGGFAGPDDAVRIFGLHEFSSL
jgi:hypothetical protein